MITSELFECFATSLFEEAINLRSKKGDRMAYGSSTNYLSGIKVFIKQKFKRNYFPLLMNEEWGLVRRSLEKAFRKRAFEKGEKVSNHHAAGSLDDLKALSLVSIWEGSVRLNSFRLLIISLYQCAGRSVEVGSLKKQHIELFNVIYVDVARIKTFDDQTLSIFPHRENYLICWYHSLASYLLVNDSPDENLFPDLASLVADDLSSDNTKKKLTLTLTVLSDLLLK